MVGEEILSEIDSTLDQLIANAEAMQEGTQGGISQIEIDAFQKTQESLLAHLIHMDEMLENKRKELKTPHRKMAKYQIQEKLLRFEKMNANFIENVSSKIGVVKTSSRKRKKAPVSKSEMRNIT